MAQFLANMVGAKGPASRLGTKQSGMWASIRSWEEQVTVSLYHDADAGRDMARVALGEPGGGYSVVLYNGPCDGWRAHQNTRELGRAAWSAAYVTRVYDGS